MSKKKRKKLKKEEKKFDKRMAKQRAKKGYCDLDVWNFDTFFSERVSEMLEELAQISHGYCPLDEEGNIIPPHEHYLIMENPDADETVYTTRWANALKRMAFLCREMSEISCSRVNPYENELDEIYKVFEKKYGICGQKLNAINGTENRFYSPKDDPDPEVSKPYKELWQKWMDYEDETQKYRESCKKEFFTMFEKYFFYLWD